MADVAVKASGTSVTKGCGAAIAIGANISTYSKGITHIDNTTGTAIGGVAYGNLVNTAFGVGANA